MYGAALDVLDERYHDVLALAPEGVRLAGLPELPQFAARFGEVGYVRLPGVLDEAATQELVAALWPLLTAVAFPVVVPHRPAETGLSSGGRLRRVDSRSLDGAQGDALDQVLVAIGFVDFARRLAEVIDPIVAAVTGGLVYERAFANLYEEGDYLTPHDDAHMGSRYDVNLSVTLGGDGGLRVLEGALLAMQYDGGGSVGILGPGTWHEVPVLLRRAGGPAPRRMTITLRYWPPS